MMRKHIALLTCLLLLMGLASGMAVAEEERVIVYASIPSDWSYPCLWAWGDDGTNAFAAWPGEQMEPDAQNEGWFYAYVPKNMDCVIVSANDGGVQTGDYRIDKQNAWLTIESADKVDVSFEAKTQGDLPAFTERYTVYAKVDETWQSPAIWAWQDPSGVNAFAAWPGRGMKANANGWYAARVPVAANAIIINANDGGVQTGDIKDIDPVDVWVTVDAEGQFDFTYDDPNAIKAENITVYAKVPEGWEAPCLWAWSHPDGTNAFGAWPGEAFTMGEDGWYVAQAPGFINSVIVNGNGGSVQTADITVEAGKDIYLTVVSPEETAIAYE